MRTGCMHCKPQTTWKTFWTSCLNAFYSKVGIITGRHSIIVISHHYGNRFYPGYKNNYLTPTILLTGNNSHRWRGLFQNETKFFYESDGLYSIIHIREIFESSNTSISLITTRDEGKRV